MAKMAKLAKLDSLEARQKHIRGLAEAARKFANQESRAKIIQDHNNLQNDSVLARMLKEHAGLTLDKYLEYAFLGDPPDGIENDHEFLAAVPDVIRANTKRVQ